MPEGRDKTLDKETLARAFGVMGGYLAERGLLCEIAVYGGSAIMLQFDWRRTTHDVDAVVLFADETGGPPRSVARHAAFEDAVAYAKVALDLDEGWLNRAVDGFQADDEVEGHFLPMGSYPRGGTVGLRVLLARPEYLCAMKLSALKRTDVGDKDFDDALALALASGVADENGLRDLYAGFFPDDALHPRAELRLPELAAALKGPAR